MNEGVTIESDGTVRIDHLRIEAQLAKLAQIWNVPADRALILAVEQALMRDQDRGR